MSGEEIEQARRPLLDAKQTFSQNYDNQLTHSHSDLNREISDTDTYRKTYTIKLLCTLPIALGGSLAAMGLGTWATGSTFSGVSSDFAAAAMPYGVFMVAGAGVLGRWVIQQKPVTLLIPEPHETVSNLYSAHLTSTALATPLEIAAPDLENSIDLAENVGKKSAKNFNA